MLYYTAQQIRAMVLSLTSYSVALLPDHPHERDCEYCLTTLQIIYEKLPKVIRDNIQTYEKVTNLFYDKMAEIVIEEDLRMHRETRGRMSAFLAADREVLLAVYREKLQSDDVHLITRTPFRAIKFKNGNEVRFFNTDDVPVNHFTSTRWSGIYQLISMRD